MTHTITSFGQLLQQVRKRVGMTQSDLARVTGYTAGLISHLEQGRRLPDVAAVAQVFVPALHLQDDPQLATRLVELAALAHGDASPPASLLLPSLNGNPNRAEETNQRPPTAPTRLLGREQELKTIIAHFAGQQTRLLTLIGPPGVGKTRLALEAMTHLHPLFGDGTGFVSLAATSDPNLLVAAIIDGLQMKDSGAAQPLQRLIRHLRHKEMLLVLDNFEQLLGTSIAAESGDSAHDEQSAASLLAELLGECPNLHLLVTSRQRLHLRAEHRLRVPPLELAAAVTLFVQRAQAVQPSLLLTTQNRLEIETLCRHLDCLPLALELVTVQTELFSPKQLLTRLHQRGLDLLDDGPHDLPVRQRTLRTAIESSYELLSAEEQRLFCALSVFVGGFDQEAVEALDFSEETLRSLVNKSLVSSAPGDPEEPRYLLLETLRRYAAEQLQQHGDLENLRKSHAEYFVTMAENLGPYETTVNNRVWFKRFWVDYENIRTALEWAIQQCEVEIALRFIWPLRWFLCFRMDYYMIGVWARRVANLAEAQWSNFCTLSKEEIDPIIKKQIDLLSRAWYTVAGVTPDPQEWETSIQRSLALNRLLEPNDLTPTIYQQLAGMEDGRGNKERAGELNVEALKIAHSLRSVPDHIRKNQIAWSIQSQGYDAFYRGALQEARDFFEQVIHLFLEIEQSDEAANSYGLLAEIALYQGDLEQAQVSYKFYVKEYSEDSDQFATRIAYLDIVFAIHRGEWQRAANLLLHNIKQFPIDENALLTYSDHFWRLTRVAAYMNWSEITATLLGATDEILHKRLYALQPVYQPEYEAARTLTRSQLDQATFDAAYARGAAMDAKALIDFILVSFQTSVARE